MDIQPIIIVWSIQFQAAILFATVFCLVRFWDMKDKYLCPASSVHKEYKI